MGEHVDPRIERAARALAISHGTDPDQEGPGQRHVVEVDGVTTIIPDHFGPLWKMWVRDAEAVIGALDDLARIPATKEDGNAGADES